MIAPQTWSPGPQTPNMQLMSPCCLAGTRIKGDGQEKSASMQLICVSHHASFQRACDALVKVSEYHDTASFRSMPVSSNVKPPCFCCCNNELMLKSMRFVCCVCPPTPAHDNHSKCKPIIFTVHVCLLAARME